MIRSDIDDVNIEDILEDFKLKSLCYLIAYTDVPERDSNKELKPRFSSAHLI